MLLVSHKVIFIKNDAVVLCVTMRETYIKTLVYNVLI